MIYYAFRRISVGILAQQNRSNPKTLCVGERRRCKRTHAQKKNQAESLKLKDLKATVLHTFALISLSGALILVQVEGRYQGVPRTCSDRLDHP
jgi:hypothetical protein